MLFRPPQHDITAKAVFIVEADDAWDKARIENEREVRDPEGKEKETHPVDRYAAGETRYDLDAEMSYGGEMVTARSYITGRATRFVLRRLSRAHYREIRGDILGGRAARAYLNACRYGLDDVSVVGVHDGERFELERAPGSPLTEKDLDALHDLDPNLIDEIGMAVWLFSRKLDPREKKVSA